ncbi:MAG: hypothetical protein LBT40_05325 [Deltaproteobacteria bacterium]|nr:hypothetical protein [Deltaproteobacteria bacterium]
MVFIEDVLVGYNPPVESPLGGYLNGYGWQLIRSKRTAERMKEEARRGKERKGEERRGKERKGEERRGKESKGE